MRIPSKYIGQEDKCAGCSEKVVVVNSSPPTQPAGSDAVLYEPAPDGTYLLHRISEHTPDSPLSHLTLIPGTFEEDGSPYYFMTSDCKSGFKGEEKGRRLLCYRQGIPFRIQLPIGN